MTPLQQAIHADLTVNPGATAAEIGQRLGKSSRAVTNSLMFMRGHGQVDDGSQATEVFDANGNLTGIAHTYAPNPIKWNLM